MNSVHSQFPSIFYGHPLVLSEERDKFVPVWKQEVLNEKGKKKRFHGAFTGGFSAGYFNTVGSKEGFQPASFSSKSVDKETYVPRLMDEEDLEDVRSDLSSRGDLVKLKVSIVEEKRIERNDGVWYPCQFLLNEAMSISQARKLRSIDEIDVEDGFDFGFAKDKFGVFDLRVCEKEYILCGETRDQNIKPFIVEPGDVPSDFVIVKIDESQKFDCIQVSLVDKYSVPAGIAYASLSGYIPSFIGDSGKRDRYLQFLRFFSEKGSENRKEFLSDEFYKGELDEFKKAALIFKPLSATMAQRFTSEKNLTIQMVKESQVPCSGTIKSVIVKSDSWSASSVLCKRLGIRSMNTVTSSPSTPSYTRDYLDQNTMNNILFGSSSSMTYPSPSILEDQVDIFLKSFSARPSIEIFESIFNKIDSIPLDTVESDRIVFVSQKKNTLVSQDSNIPKKKKQILSFLD